MIGRVLSAYCISLLLLALHAVYVNAVAANTIITLGGEQPAAVAADPNSAFIYIALDQPVDSYGPSNNYMAPLASFTNLESPHNLFVDNVGTLWIADTLNQRVIYFHNAASLPSGASPDGVIGPSIGSAGIMQQPSGIYVDASGGAWVTDAQLNRVYYFPSGQTTPTVVLGAFNFTSGCTPSLLNGPFGVYGASNGDVFIADSYNNRVLHFSAAQAKVNFGAASNVFMQTTLLSSAAPAPGATTGNGPYAVVVDSLGDIAIADTQNNRVLIYLSGLAQTTNGVAASDVLGQASFQASLIGFDDSGMSAPHGLSLQESTQTLWVADYSNFRVLGFILNLNPSSPTGTGTGAASRLPNPLAMLLDSLF